MKSINTLGSARCIGAAPRHCERVDKRTTLATHNDAGGQLLWHTPVKHPGRVEAARIWQRVAETVHLASHNVVVVSRVYSRHRRPVSRPVISNNTCITAWTTWVRRYKNVQPQRVLVQRKITGMAVMTVGTLRRANHLHFAPVTVMGVICYRVKGKGSSLDIAPLTILDSGALHPRKRQLTGIDCSTAAQAIGCP